MDLLHLREIARARGHSLSRVRIWFDDVHADLRFYAYNTGLQLFGGDGVGFTPMQLTTVAGMFSGVVEATVCLTPGEAISVAMLHDNMRKAPQFAGKGQFGTAAALIKAEGVTVLCT